MSSLNESCHIWMSHVKSEWVMSHMNASHQVWKSRVLRTCVVWHLNESCHVWMSQRDNAVYWKTDRKIINDLQWVVSHLNGSCCIRMGHVTYEMTRRHFLRVATSYNTQYNTLQYTVQHITTHSATGHFIFKFQVVRDVTQSCSKWLISVRNYSFIWCLQHTATHILEKQHVSFMHEMIHS